MQGGFVFCWSFEEILGTLSGDPPPAVVDGEVAEPAQQHPVINICSAVVFIPVVDVVRFAPRRWPVAHQAPPITGGKSCALLLGEESLLPPEVQHPPTVLVEQDRDRTGSADEPFRGCDRDGGILPFEERGAGSDAIRIGGGVEVAGGDQDPHGRLPVTRDC